MRPSLGFPLASTWSLFWSLSNSYPQKPGNLLRPFGEKPWTCPKRSEPSFLLLAFIYAAASGSWFNSREKKPQTEFGWARWLRRWQNSPYIVDRSYNIPCETYRSRSPRFWPWVCLQIHLLRLGGKSRGGSLYLSTYIGQCQELGG